MVHPEVFPENESSSSAEIEGFQLESASFLQEKKEKPFRVLSVGVDLDDTFFHIAKPSLKKLNEEFRTYFTADDIETFWYVQDFLRRIGKTEKEIESFLNEVYRSLDDEHRVYRDSPPISGGIEVLNGIYRVGHEPLVVTSRPPGLEVIAEEQFRAVGIDWINGDWVDGGNILIRDEYYWEKMTGEEFKLRVIRGDFPDGKYKDFPGLDVHLDDMGELLYHPLATEIREKIFILAQRHNIKITPKENLVNNWLVFYKVIRCLERGEGLDWLMSHNIDTELVEV